MAKKIAWGILSTGAIAKAFLQGVRTSKTGELVAVASRTPDRAAAFADEHGVPSSHGSYEDLLANPDVDAVYIATPHPYHAEWAIKAAEAGKHILCEKPMTMNRPEAEAIFEAAERHGVFAMEAFM
jgi:predicted dehydrogenase